MCLWFLFFFFCNWSNRLVILFEVFHETDAHCESSNIVPISSYTTQSTNIEGDFNKLQPIDGRGSFSNKLCPQLIERSQKQVPCDWIQRHSHKCLGRGIQRETKMGFLLLVILLRQSSWRRFFCISESSESFNLLCTVWISVMATFIYFWNFSSLPTESCISRRRIWSCWRWSPTW